MKPETSAANECLNEIILSGKNVPAHVKSKNCKNCVGKKSLHSRRNNRSFLLKLSNNELKTDSIKSSKEIKPEGLFNKENPKKLNFELILDVGKT